MDKKYLDKMDAEAKEYFNSLPVSMQETIMGCGVTMTTKEQLETYCKNVSASKADCE